MASGRIGARARPTLDVRAVLEYATLEYGLESDPCAPQGAQVCRDGRGTSELEAHSARSRSRRAAPGPRARRGCRRGRSLAGAADGARRQHQPCHPAPPFERGARGGCVTDLAITHSSAPAPLERPGAWHRGHRPRRDGYDNAAVAHARTFGADRHRKYRSDRREVQDDRVRRTDGVAGQRQPLHGAARNRTRPPWPARRCVRRWSVEGRWLRGARRLRSDCHAARALP